MGTDAPARQRGKKPHELVALEVIPYEVAQRDVALIKAVVEAKTLGDVRRSPLALPLVRKRFANREFDGAPPFHTLPDDTPFDWYDELDVYWRPEARLRTADLAPPSVLAKFGRPDRGYGMDYEPATWLPLEEQAEIEAALRHLGHEIVYDATILPGYRA